MIALKALRAIEDAMKAGAGQMQTERASTSGTAGVARAAPEAAAAGVAAEPLGSTAEAAA